MDDPKYRNLQRYTLASWYLLPLVGLNPYDFGGLDNFYNCYVSPEGRYLFVSIYSPEFCRLPMESPFYRGNKDDPKTTEHFMVFEIPEYWIDDFVTYMAGEYSKFSQPAKDAIIKYSGLGYRIAGEDGRVMTDMRLLALSTDLGDRVNMSEEWGRMFNSDPPDPEKELLWPPSGDEYIELDPP